jgi:hypothetical protein
MSVTAKLDQFTLKHSESRVLEPWLNSLHLVVNVVYFGMIKNSHSLVESVDVSTSCQPFPLCRSFTSESSPSFSTSLLHSRPLSEDIHCKSTSDDDFQMGTLSFVLQSVMNRTQVLINQTTAGRTSQRRSVLMNCLVSHAVPMIEFEMGFLGAVRILVLLVSVIHLP